MVIERDLSYKIVLVVNREKHLIETSDAFLLKTKPLKERRVHEDYALDLDTMEKFADTPSAFSLGSGFFIAKNIIATAAHVPLEATRYKHTSLKDILFINCFCEHSLEEMMVDDNIFIPKEHVFKPMFDDLKKGAFDYSARYQDWALIPVTNLADEPVNENFIEPDFQEVQEKDSVTWIGHPLGLPVATVSKYNDLEIIRSEDEHFFEIQNLSFAGLSGAPVLNKDNKVVGILARGIGQFELNEAGTEVKLSQLITNEFEGAECQRISNIKEQFSSLIEKIRKPHLA